VKKRCPRLLNLTRWPGQAPEHLSPTGVYQGPGPEGPPTHVSLQCGKRKGHDDPHWFPGLQNSVAVAGEGATIVVTAEQAANLRLA